MRRTGNYPPVGGERRYLMLPLPRNLPKNFRNIFLVMMLIAGSNFLTHWMRNADFMPRTVSSSMQSSSEDLYLIDKAGLFVSETRRFEDKVRDISNLLNIPPEWLMAVIYAESRFDPAVVNYQGSGAVGLIQFLPGTAAELDVSSERLRRMDALQQLEYVFMYLQNTLDRYGEFGSLTDLYLAILYPKAIGQDPCYTLFGKPSKAYERNSGLDEDRDGRITVSDIDKRMKRLFPTAYMMEK